MTGGGDKGDGNPEVDESNDAATEGRSAATIKPPDESKHSPPGVSPADIDALRTAERASEREYDKLVASVEEIDDKAMRTVRTTVIILGFVVSAIGISGPEALGEISVLPVFFGAWGVTMLLVSVMLGIATYAVTTYDAGVGPEYRETIIRTGVTGREALSVHVSLLDRSISELRTEVARESTALGFVQVLLVVGAIALVVAAASITATEALGVNAGVGGTWFLTILLAALAVAVGLLAMANRLGVE